MIRASMTQFTYLAFNQFLERITCHDLLVFCVIPNFFDEDRNNLVLHLDVSFENVDCVHEYVAELVYIPFGQEKFNTVAFTQILVDCELLDFFFRLKMKHKRLTLNR